jgi:hypothetical protein
MSGMMRHANALEVNTDLEAEVGLVVASSEFLVTRPCVCVWLHLLLRVILFRDEIVAWRNYRLRCACI